MNDETKPDRPALISRLFKVLEKQIQLLEENMASPGDKEVALLGTITRNLEKLIDLDRKEDGGKTDKLRSREIDDLRQKLVARIDQLRKA